MPEHRWRLHYPKSELIEDTMEIYGIEDPKAAITELQTKILQERRATISTTYTPLSKWLDESEIHKIDTSVLTDKIATIIPKNKMYKNTVVELMIIPGKMYLYQNQDINNVNELALLEFYVDYSNNLIFINLEGYESQEIIFDVRYQQINNLSYTWYVSLYYPEPKKELPMLPLLPLLDLPEEEKERANIIIQMGVGGCAYQNQTRAYILNKDNKVVAYGRSFKNPQYIIDSSYADKIRIHSENDKWLELDNADEYKIVFFNFSGNDHPCDGSQLHILRVNPSTEEYLDTCIMKNTDSYLVSSIIDNDALLGQQFPYENTMPPNIIIGENEITLIKSDGTKIEDLIVTWNTSEINSVVQKNKDIQNNNEKIKAENKRRELENEKIREENKSMLQDSYFIWQIGKEIDISGFIKQHKGFDSPVFACFFHNYKSFGYGLDYSWNPITYYITWDEKGCAFMFCEDPVAGDTVHGISYFGSLTNFPQKLLDDYKGNFGSFGNNLLEADLQEVMVPGFDGKLTSYIGEKYNINIYLRSWLGDVFIIQLIESPIISFYDSEVLIDIEDVLNINDSDEINSLPLIYHMVGAEFLKFKEVVMEIYDNTYNYYIDFYDDSITPPKLSPISINGDIEIYLNDIETIIIPEIINIDLSSSYQPYLTFESSNNNVVINLDNNILTINPNGFLGDFVLTLISKVKLEKYEKEFELVCETKEIKIIIWDFADVTYEVTNNE